MAPKYPVLSEEAQLAMKQEFDRLWQTLGPGNDTATSWRVIITILGTLLAGADNFHYLPSEERVKIFTLADWAFRLGFLLGRAPTAMVELLNSVDHLRTKVEAPEWFKPLLEEYKAG